MGLTVHVTPADPKAESLQFETTIKANDVTLQKQQDRWTGAISMAVGVRDKDGKELFHKAETANLRFVQSSYDGIQQNGMTISGQVPLKPGAEQLRIVVRDDTSGNIGSITVPVR